MVKLANLKKPELQQLCQTAGFKYPATAKKDELVEILEEGMRAHPALANHSAFAEYFDTRASPAKRATKAPTESPDEEKVVKRRKTITKTEAPSEPQTAIIPRTPGSLQRLASRVTLPSSPALNRAVSAQTTYLSNQYKTLVKKSGIKSLKSKIPLARQDFSSIQTIQVLILIFEAAGLRRFTIPFVTTETPAFASLKVKPYSIPVPLVTNLITTNFWAPTTLWLLTSLIVPGAFSWAINLTYANPRPRTRRTAPKREFDPLVFSIVKALTAYVVYSPTSSFRFFGLYDAPSVDIVNEYVYGGYQTMLIGALIGVLTSYTDNLSFKS